MYVLMLSVSLRLGSTRNWTQELAHTRVKHIPTTVCSSPARTAWLPPRPVHLANVSVPPTSQSLIYNLISTDMPTCAHHLLNLYQQISSSGFCNTDCPFFFSVPICPTGSQTVSQNSTLGLLLTADFLAPSSSPHPINLPAGGLPDPPGPLIQHLCCVTSPEPNLALFLKWNPV